MVDADSMEPSSPGDAVTLTESALIRWPVQAPRLSVPIRKGRQK